MRVLPLVLVLVLPLLLVLEPLWPLPRPVRALCHRQPQQQQRA